jgi:3-oxoacyl-[acyl-carrier protein] reductase
VDTEMNPASGDFAAALLGLMAIPRHAQVDEIASLRVYLATPEAAFVTGADLVFGGGFSA